MSFKNCSVKPASETDPIYIFLMYVGRSGSTFLARQIAENTNSVLVFAETKLIDNLLSVSDRRFRNFTDHERLQLVKKDPRWVNLGIEENKLKEICIASTTRKEFFASICKLKLNHIAPVKYILIKNGASVTNFGEISTFFCNRVMVLHSRRDPRGSTCSRMRKAPVYKRRAGIRMEDPWFLAQYWRRYNLQIEKIRNRGVRVIEVHYEDLILSTKNTITKLFHELDLATQTQTSTTGNFMLSNKEREEKHKNVLGPALENRTIAWKNELPTETGVIVEALCSKEIDTPYFTPKVSATLRQSILIKAYAKHLFYSAIRLKEKLTPSRQTELGR